MMWGSTQKYAGKNIRERMKPLEAAGMKRADIARALGCTATAVTKAAQREARGANKGHGRPRKGDQ